ncbi:MAG: glycosyltransferase family 2 protein [bacterium]
MKLSIIIPVYNEESTIKEVLEKIETLSLPIEKEIIVVNDGSTDKTFSILEQMKKTNKEISVVYNSLINIGKGAAVRIGFQHVKGDIILIQDADLELDPNEIKHLIEPILQNKTKVVYGSRYLTKNKKITFLNYVANKFLSLLTNFLYKSKISDMETAYKVFKKEVLSDIKLKSLKFDFEPEITAKILKKGYKIMEIPIGYNPRSSYEGKKIGWKDGVMAIYTLLKIKFQKEKF